MDISTFVADLPKLHDWGDHWSTGGFNPEHLVEIYGIAKRDLGTANPRVIEIGAGNSTIVFLLANAARLLSVALEPELGDRIFKYCADHGIDSTKLEYVAGRSEQRLPELYFENRTAEKFDLALIDGAHGWPNVFVDFCYSNAMLRQNGLMMLDDVQLYSVGELARFLDVQPHFQRVGQVGKLCIWKKVWAHEFLPDFGGQPYIKDRSGLA